MAAALLALAAGLGLAGAADAADLLIRFPGLKPEGRLSVAVFDAPEAWSRRRPSVSTATPEVDATEVAVRLSLPPGRYAVMAYHDRNANGRLDTLPIGLPVEPYGFSNNSRGRFGPPSWTAAAFELPDGGAVQVIRLH